MNWRKHFEALSDGADFGADVDFGVDGDSIKSVQSALNAGGFANPPLTVDGASGPKTSAAVKAFQQSKGMTADGVIGPAVMSALGLKVTAATTNGGISKLIATPSDPISGLRQSVVDVYPNFTQHFEGYVPYMYTDIKGYVSTGIGNLLDPESLNTGLPWKNADGSLASASDVSAAWHRVKAAWPGVQGANAASKNLNNGIHLDADGISKLVNGKLKSNHQYLKGKYPNYTNWPADAQLAMHAISWAWGPAFAGVWGSNGQQFLQAANGGTPDFTALANLNEAANVHENSINPGIIPRNAAIKALFLNAAEAQKNGSDPNKLFYPDVFSTAVTGIVGLAGGTWLVAGAVVVAGVALVELFKGLRS